MANLKILLIVLLCNSRGGSSMQPPGHGLFGQSFEPHYFQEIDEQSWVNGDDGFLGSHPTADPSGPHPHYDIQHDSPQFSMWSTYNIHEDPTLTPWLIEQNRQNTVKFRGNPHEGLGEPSSGSTHYISPDGSGQYAPHDAQDNTHQGADLPKKLDEAGAVAPFNVPPELDIPCGYIATSNYPLTTYDVTVLIDAVYRIIAHSSFDQEYTIPDHLRFVYAIKLAGRYKEISIKQRFLIRLCLKNIEFLLGIHQKLDSQIEKEVASMLVWLRHILAPSSTPSPSESSITQAIQTAVTEHFATFWPGNEFIRIQKQGSIASITHYDAAESRILLFVMGNYYRSTNPQKWGSIFTQDISFFKYFINVTTSHIVGKIQSKLNKQWSTYPDLDLLPWNAILKEKFPVKTVPFFFTKRMSDMFSKRLKPPDTGNHWDDFLKWEDRVDLIQ